VKGLEPEIGRIVERNKDELRKAQNFHNDDLGNQRQAWLNDHESKLQELRERLLKEKEQAVEKEREKSQTKLTE